MIIDKKLLLKEDSNFYADGTASDVLQFGGNVIGEGNLSELFILVTTSFAGAGSETWQFKLQGSSDGSSYSDILLTPALGASDLSAGTLLQYPLPANDYEYFKLVVVATGTPSAGKITTGFNLG